MLGKIVSLLILCGWVMVLTQHARRLLHLAHVRASPPWRPPHLRQRLDRVWWLLGRPEFWRPMLIDCWRCAQLTILLLLLLWGAAA
jgi:hypothetical protein